MNAVFVHKNAILRDSHVDVGSSPETWALAPATLEALRMLLRDDRLIFIIDSVPACAEDGEHDALRHLQELVRQIEAGGGQIDGLSVCAHRGAEPCACWAEAPALIGLPAAQFSLDLTTSYVIADALPDVTAAYGAGVRPMLLLGERSIGEVFGDRASGKDCTNLPDLTTAAHDIAIEDEISAQIGSGREPSPQMTADLVLATPPEALPRLLVTSERARALLDRVIKSKAQLRDMGRWLTFFVVGALGLALGLAYLLTHLYRVQPFPEWIYYITLQFISRPVRGVLFIALGLAVIVLGIRSLGKPTRVWRLRQK